MITDVLKCPRCGHEPIGRGLEAFVGLMRCGEPIGAGRGYRRGCGAHWWANRLETGNVRAQLLADYNDPALVDRIINDFSLPESIDRPMFWEIELTGNQAHHYNRDSSSPGTRGRSAALLQSVVHRAS